MNVIAKLDEILTMIQTVVQTDGRENSIPSQTQLAGGIKRVVSIATESRNIDFLEVQGQLTP